MSKQKLIESISYCCSVLLDPYRGKKHSEFEARFMGSKKQYDILGDTVKAELYYYQGLGCVSMRTVYDTIEVSVLYSSVKYEDPSNDPYIIIHSADFEKPLIMYLEKLINKP